MEKARNSSCYLVMALVCMSGSETGSIAFIDDVTAEQDVAEVAG